MEILLIFAVVFAAVNIILASRNGTIAYLVAKIRGFFGLDK